MKGQLKAATPAEYIEQLKEPRKSDIAGLDALIRKTAPKLEPFIHSGMLAYGRFHYKYDSGREGDWFRLGIASNAAAISLYVGTADSQGKIHIAEKYKEALPKANVGKGCIRFKRLSDLDPDTLKRMIQEIARAAK